MGEKKTEKKKQKGEREKCDHLEVSKLAMGSTLRFPVCLTRKYYRLC